MVKMYNDHHADSLCSSFATLLRQPNLFRWNAYMDECVNVLENSSDAILYDRILCQWAKLQHLGDEFVETFDQDDVHSTLSSSAQSELENFKDRVHILRNQIPKDLRSGKTRGLFISIWVIGVRDYKRRLTYS